MDEQLRPELISRLIKILCLFLVQLTVVPVVMHLFMWKVAGVTAGWRKSFRAFGLGVLMFEIIFLTCSPAHPWALGIGVVLAAWASLELMRNTYERGYGPCLAPWLIFLLSEAAGFWFAWIVADLESLDLPTILQDLSLRGVE